MTERDSTLVRGAKISTYRIESDGFFPNNPRLPLLLYERVLELTSKDPAKSIEKLFAENGWTGSWIDGIYAFHHYHSTAHEVLGILQGTASVRFGGDAKGVTLEVSAGDLVVIPAGIAHKNLGASGDFSVIGAYPAGQHHDLCQGEPDELRAAEENIARVPLPRTDPIYGEAGPLLEAWASRTD